MAKKINKKPLACPKFLHNWAISRRWKKFGLFIVDGVMIQIAVIGTHTNPPPP
ncbi:hypothetical protein HAX54_019641, partial [Datura stramonium]|nr:hypothetical protein [Datura stramonium]